MVPWEGRNQAFSGMADRSHGSVHGFRLHDLRPPPRLVRWPSSGVQVRPAYAAAVKLVPRARQLQADDPDREGLERAIAGALRAAIRDHGPITTDKIGSAVKRVIGSLANATLVAGPPANRRAPRSGSHRY